MTERWTAARKAEVVRLVEAGQLTEATVIQMHRLTREELDEWRRRYAVGGVGALKMRNTKIFRKPQS